MCCDLPRFRGGGGLIPGHTAGVIGFKIQANPNRSAPSPLAPALSLQLLPAHQPPQRANKRRAGRGWVEGLSVPDRPD